MTDRFTAGYRSRRHLALALTLGSACAAGVVAAPDGPAPAAWTAELQIATKGVGTPRLSPDGKRVVYVVSRDVMTADKSEFLTHLHLVGVDGKDKLQLTWGDKSSSSPRWSPDGRHIAFLSARKDNRNALYLLSLAGGEAEPLTDMKAPLGEFRWSPDGKSIAFVMADPRSDEDERNAKGRNDARWLDEDWKMARLYIVDVAAAGAPRAAPKRLTANNFHVTGEFDFSPDGRLIAFAHRPSPSANEWPNTDVSLVDVATGVVAPFLESAAAESAPIFSPDGKSIAVRVSDAPPRWAQTAVINVITLADKRVTRLAATNDSLPDIVRWSADGRRIYFTEANGTRTDTNYFDLIANEVVSLQRLPAVINALDVSADGTRLVFVMQTSDGAPEVYASDAGTFAPVRLSQANVEQPGHPLGRTELIRWSSKDGRDIEGLVTYPVGYRAGTRVPTILMIHGGPAGVFQQTYTAGRFFLPIATYAARGYAVLRPNPRGSTGYGTAFRRDVVKGFGVGDYDDLMSGVDHLVRLGVADPDRLGVTGWSYGGYMTSWIVTQTQRFKAAVAIAPLTNLVSFTTTSDVSGFIPGYFDAQHWDDARPTRSTRPSPT
ncbi:S9 family peptidase [Aquincola sp. S2]|uniref:S9 family peptidase n=1 Tax=Pseudaquabacterium terrae TaxID=2732868 RepID=A0ABX2ESB9_9BURK|nr:S9 family peptidase [Aquabacterium terrae]NRF71498.1 S9 family peptidase [Aquabacterium terrae]